jgi:hypothetical protein
MNKMPVAMYLARKRMARYDELLHQAEALWKRERAVKVAVGAKA